MDNTLYQNIERDVTALADTYSAEKLRINTLDFDFIFERSVKDNQFYLVTTKAVIRVMGKTTKVAIGANETYKTYDEAWEATKKYWSEYYRDVRTSRTPAQVRADSRRQKLYQAARKAKLQELERRG